MVNAWSLAWEVLYGDMDKTYPIKDDDGLDYENDYYGDYMADVDDQRAHHFTNANSPYNDGWTREYHQNELDKMDYEPKHAHYYKSVSYTHLTLPTICSV